MHPNEKLLRDVDEAMERGDMDTMWGAHASDVVAHIAGKSSLAGTYKGLDQMQELFGKFMERVGEFKFEPHSYFADDEHGVAVQKSHLNKGGTVLDSDDIFIFHFREGKIAEFWMTSFQQDELDKLIG